MVTPMRKKSLWLIVLGLLLLTAGAKLFMLPGHQSYVPLWVSWLVGPLLWYGGFIAVCAWCLRRFMLSGTGQELGKPEPATKGDTMAPVSNFLEHDTEPPQVSISKVALIGLVILVAAAFTPTISATVIGHF